MSPNVLPSSDALRPHVRVADIAAAWGLHPMTVRRMFRDVPGVLRLRRSASRKRRGYETLLIPEAVLERVYRERCSAGK